MISVVIPCFNAATYIGAALESVFAQTTPVTEVIVVDDGSSDQSADVVRSFGQRVRQLAQPNSGASAARNAGVAASGGELIAFLDADDLWLPTSLERLLAALGDDVDGSVGEMAHFVSPDLDPEQAARRVIPAPRIARMAGALLLRRRAFDRVGPFDVSLRMGEFMDWFSRFDACGLRLAECPAMVVRRRIHATNTVHQREHTQASYLASLRQNIARRRGGATS